MFQVLRAAEHSDSLQKLNIADTGLRMLDYQPERETCLELLAHQLILLMSKNERILKYDIRFNPMHNEIAEQLLKAIEGNITIRKMEFSSNVSYALRDALDSVIRKRGKKRAGKKAAKKK
jgi:predicted outer membrane protein